MEGDIFVEDHFTAVIGQEENHDERPTILHIKDSGPIPGPITM